MEKHSNGYRKIMKTCACGRHVMAYNSIQEAADMNHVSYRTMVDRVRNGRVSDGYSYSYINPIVKGKHV